MFNTTPELFAELIVPGVTIALGLTRTRYQKKSAIHFTKALTRCREAFEPKRLMTTCMPGSFENLLRSHHRAIRQRI
jgi:hypothetical protein